MSSSALRLLVRIGRWPRRIAALLCLLLAAGSAMLPSTPASTTSSAKHGVSAGLRSGEVAVAVPIGSMAGLPDIRAGDPVGVLAQPGGASGGPAVLVADHLRVVSIHSDTPGIADARTVIVVATDRRHALLLARYLGQPLLLMIDHYP